jgi:hypothetical protein
MALSLTLRAAAWRAERASVSTSGRFGNHYFGDSSSLSRQPERENHLDIRCLKNVILMFLMRQKYDISSPLALEILRTEGCPFPPLYTLYTKQAHTECACRKYRNIFVHERAHNYLYDMCVCCCKLLTFDSDIAT